MYSSAVFGSAGSMVSFSVGSGAAGSLFLLLSINSMSSPIISVNVCV